MGQMGQLEAAVVERTRQLNRLLEDQVKKQYEVMKREVRELAKGHQRDVQQLEERFKSKMSGLASRFKQLEAEEERVKLIEADNKALGETVEQLQRIIEEQDARNEASLAAIGEREGQIGQMTDEMRAMAAAADAERADAAERQRRADADRAEMEAMMAKLQATIDRKKEDLKAMQKRIVSAKSSFDSEVLRKQSEVAELEASMRTMADYTQRMGEMTKAVQGQIMAREADMKTQLALMKNTIAFALYIDETLQVDLTDPSTTALLADPVTVHPSGVTYSHATVEKLLADAAAAGKPAVCPQTKAPIESWSRNVALESILSRYLFKQQITNDVMRALSEYQSKNPAGEEDQPLEQYLQRMKASMVERMETIHQEAMAKAAAECEQKVEVRGLELDKMRDAAERAAADVEAARAELAAYRKQVLLDNAQYEGSIEELQAQLRGRSDELDACREKRDELNAKVMRLSAKLTKLEEGVEDDADALDDPGSNKQVQRVRKEELLRLKAELTQGDARLEEWKARVAERDGTISSLREQLDSLRRELAGEKRISADLTEEKAHIEGRLRTLQQEAASAGSDLAAAREALQATEDRAEALQSKVTNAALDSTETAMKVGQLEKDNEKLRARLAAKEELARHAQSDLSDLQAKYEEATAESSRRDRLLATSRQAALDEKQRAVEADQSAAWLSDQTARLEALIAKREGENAALAERATSAEAQRPPQGRLESAGIQMSDAALGMRDLASVQKEVGVFDPLAQLPNVPVLKSLVETIDLAQSDLGRLTGANGALSQMANVSALQIDQTIPPDETEGGGLAARFARRDVPLPDEKVLLRQFTPPSDDGHRGSRRRGRAAAATTTTTSALRRPRPARMRVVRAAHRECRRAHAARAELARSSTVQSHAKGAACMARSGSGLERSSSRVWVGVYTAVHIVYHTYGVSLLSHLSLVNVEWIELCGPANRCVYPSPVRVR